MGLFTPAAELAGTDGRPQRRPPGPVTMLAAAGDVARQVA